MVQTNRPMEENSELRDRPNYMGIQYDGLKK